MKKQFSIFVLAFVMVAAYAFNVSAADNIRFNTGDVFKVQSLKLKCQNAAGTNVKVKVNKASKLFMRVEKLSEFQSTGTPAPGDLGYIPATATGIYFLSSSSTGKVIVGQGIFEPGFPNNYIAEEVDLDGNNRAGAEIEVVMFKPCGEPDTICDDSVANVIQQEVELYPGFAKNNSTLQCYLNTTGFAKFKNQLPRKYIAIGNGFCYEAGQIPTSLDSIAGSTSAMMCNVQKLQLRFKYSQ